MHARLIPFIFALVLLSTGGCASVEYWWNNGLKIGPNYSRPTAPVSETWIDSDDEHVTIQNEENTNWWQAFNDPALDQLVRTAYQRNLSLKIAGLRVLEARRQQSITAANLYPQSQNFSGSYLRNQLSKRTATSSAFLPRAFDEFKTGFDLSWEIDVWGRIRRAIEAADASLGASVENYDDVLVTLIGDVAATYIEVRTFDERLELAEANIEIQAGSLNIAEIREREGKVSLLDVQEAIANLADTRASVPSLEQGRRLAVNRMALLLGMLPSELDPIFAERGHLPAIPNEVVVGIPAELLRRRPDIRAAERGVAAQSAQIGIAEAELYPQFALGGEIALNSQKFNDLFSSASNSGFISPGFSWKILNYGRLKNGVEVERLKFQQQVKTYENAVLSAHREVEDALTEFLQTKRQVEQLEISTTAVEKSVEIVQAQYKEGKVDFGRVFVLEGTLVQRQDQLVATKAQIAIALTKVYKALGGGWQLRCHIPDSSVEPLTVLESKLAESLEPIFMLGEPDDAEAEASTQNDPADEPSTTVEPKPIATPNLAVPGPPE